MSQRLDDGDQGATRDPTSIKFVVGSHELGKVSFAWRLGAAGTSFYIKPLDEQLQGFKISLHGPDPARGLTGGYQVKLDRSAEEAVEQAGGALSVYDRWSDFQEFPGHEVHPGVDHVLRFRFTEDLFDRAAVSGPRPRDPRPTDFAGLIPVPQPGYAVDVDVFISQGEPYWPDEARARSDNAVLGPQTNRAGQALTAQINHHRLDRYPSPEMPTAPLGRTGVPERFDRVRAVSATFDPLGFMWVQELWLSRMDMQARTLTAFRRPTE